MAVILPVYDDWSSARLLVQRLDDSLAAAGTRPGALSITVVDDGSMATAGPESILPERGLVVESVRVLELSRNLGHQRAIAVGLSRVAEEEGIEAVVVMDADGEDRPEDVAALLAASCRDPDRVVVARRGRRLEGWLFRLGYLLYRASFRLLTGVPIAYGNFSSVPAAQLRRLLQMPSVWNHYAASLQQLRPPVREITVDRGSRYQGESRMTWSALMLHGFRAMSVHIERICMRLLAASLAVMALSVGGTIATVLIRLLTDLAIPGWASVLTAAFVILGTQAAMFSTVLTFLVIHSRTRVDPPPAEIWRQFVRSEKAASRVAGAS